MTLNESILKICVPIIISILGITLPLIIQSVNKIDEKYNSLRFVRRFQKEWHYKAFIIILISSIFSMFYHFLIVNHFLRVWLFDGDLFNSLIEKFSSLLVIISTMSLVVFLFLLVSRIIRYYNYEGLFKIFHTRVSKQLQRDKKMVKDDFWDFIELLSYLLPRDDSKDLVKRGYSFLNAFQRNIDSKDHRYWFFKAIWKLNDKLCQQKKKPLAMTYGSDILCLLLPPAAHSGNIEITQERYNVLWQGLKAQLEYNKDDWIFLYWEQASQYRAINLGKVSKKEKYRFEEFHIALASLILFKNRYNLLKNILSFTISDTQKSPLVPSDFNDICKKFISINYEHHKRKFPYPIDNESGITHKDIVCVNRYLGILLFRLNRIESNKANIWGKPKLPKTASELKQWEAEINNLKRFTEKWQDNDNQSILNIFGFLSNDINPVIKLENLILDIRKTVFLQ